MFGRKKEEKPTLPEGLRLITKDLFQKEMLLNCSSKFKGNMVLIMDDASMKIISSTIGMYDLMEHRVNLVEHLRLRRNSYRTSAPIYFLTPTHDSVDRLVQDWSKSKTRKEAMYADCVFLYFTRALPDELFQKIAACKPLARRLKSLVELNIDYVASELQSFHFDMKSNSVFKDLFNSASQPSPSEFIIAEKLVTVCAALHEYPHIRYKASSALGASLATIFHKKFNEFIAKNEHWWYHGDNVHNDRGRCTLLLLSRSDDCLSPLMHEFTYQAMVNDLLDVENEKITYQAQTVGTAKEGDTVMETMDKDVLLNDKDTLWVELRSKHIADVIQTLSTRIRDIVNSSTGVALTTKGNEAKALSLTQMANALKQLPEYREVMSKLSQHMQMSHQCMDIFNKDGLLELSDLEQTLATGKTDEGRVPKVVDLVDQVEGELKQTTNPENRFRLLTIFIVSQKGLKAEHQGRLLAAARLDASQSKALDNLKYFGIPLLKEDEGRFGAKTLVTNKNDSDSEYASSRYACELKSILNQMQTKTLSFSEYPSVLPMPDESVATSDFGVNASARVSTSRFSRKSSNSSDGGRAKFSGTRQLIFLAGGACYSELRVVKEIMEKGGPETIIGTTGFINSTEYIENLKSL